MTGAPIVSLVCFCQDCQTGSRKLEALPGATTVREPDGGTAYVSYRKDRIRCTRGAELLEKHQLREGSATSRVTASCCNAAMVVTFADGKHWVPVFRRRLVDNVPDVEMNICTKSATSARASKAPSYPGYPLRLLTKLLGSRLAMMLGH